MASAPPEPVVNNEDEKFDNAFNEFAAGRTPAPDVAEPPEPSPPEENVPPPEPAPPEPAPAEEGEKDTSGPPPAPEPAPVVEDVPDPWAAFPEEAKAELAALKKERDDALHRAKSDAERVKGMARKLHSFTAGSATPAPPAAEPEPTEAQKALDAKVKQLREDYPEVAEPIIEMLEAQRQELSAVRTVVGRVSAERDAAIIETERQTLAERHPDFEQIAQDPKFGEWLQAQPDNIQRLATSWDARETSVALTLFKTERAEAAGQATTEAAPAAEAVTEAKAATDARREQQLEGGRDVRSKPAPAASGPPEDFDAAFDHFAKLQAEKKRQHQAVR